jgi:uncharacterized protein (DUF58 family)
VIYDVYLLYRVQSKLSGQRDVEDKLSLGDNQDILYTLHNESDRPLHVGIIDELPLQYQYRKYIDYIQLFPKSTRSIAHEIKPLSRGVYAHGTMSAMISTSFPRLLQYRKSVDTPQSVHVYPSVIQMRKYTMVLLSKTASFMGIRKIRTVGENDEFELLRSYVSGDSIKSINWHATSRRGDLIVNQYQDTRSQMVHCIIDKGRSMEMPFEGLSLLDYSINSTLVISNIVLQKHDKLGLIAFSDYIDTMLGAESKSNQLQSVQELLYKQETAFKESNFELLYHTVRKRISKRSILFIFTNFEDKYDLERNLPYFKLLNRYHLLVVISFINVEIENAALETANEKSSIYRKVVAQSTINEKAIIMRELSALGIQVILTRPEQLSINVINKYLEIKARRLK